MVHSRYSFEIKQLRSHLYLTCHSPRPSIHSPLNERTLTPLPSLPSHLTPKQDLGEFMKELSQLESVSEKISKLLERLKEFHECKIRRAAVLARLKERRRKLNENKLQLAEMKRLLVEEKKILAEKKRKLNQLESHRDA
ncbi:hypothetical protein IGI04_020112 [Brassica rapa subsp. trilocularis]|uniref:Uncharacterized protein n=1 Tax=Brassica rapa subsp. trilocularis TaxID=1813537 RepID=A0ABQ7MHS8_BRACM|nr:hypothetical protein IGI04_020112 [Brassica rapa subsp. trilocularis]